MRIAIGSDHAGYCYKELLKVYLSAHQHEVTDFGTSSPEPVDYPLFIRPVAEAVARGEFERGIVLGGSGNGEAIVANRVRGVRCCLSWNVESARLGRAHNNANLLALGERLLDENQLVKIVETWMTTGFEGGRHQRRIDLIDRSLPDLSRGPDSAGPACALAQMLCVECRGDARGVTPAEISELLPQLPEWKIINREGLDRLERVFKFKNFVQAMAFTNRVAGLAEAAGHHPALLSEWGRVTVSWWTHKIKGLHRNDFIMAAQTEGAFCAVSQAQ